MKNAKKSFDLWAKENLGKAIDFDGAYGVQCVDLAKDFIKNVLGIEPKSIGNAIEYYNKRSTEPYLIKNFDWIDNTPSFTPQKGDLAVFTSKSGNGHISVCTGEGTKSYFYSYDQNYPRSQHEPMAKIKHSYSSLLGVLRPKNQEAINPSPKIKYYKKYSGSSKSIVDALASLKIKNDFATRKSIATKNGIKNYTGTPTQNLKMLHLLKLGKLVKI